MSFTIALYAIGLILLVSYLIGNKGIPHWVYLYRAKKRGCEPPLPYSHSDPFLGTDLPRRFKKGMVDGNGTAVASSIFKAHGKTFMARPWGQLSIFTCDARVIQAVHTTYNDVLGVEPFRKPANEGLIGDSVFISDGPVWKHSRDLLKPIFKRSEVAYLENFEPHV